MKNKLFIFIAISLISASLQAQSGKSGRKQYYVLITDTSFVQAIPEQGATFKAYFKNDSLYKIETWFGFNFGEVKREYYFWGDSIKLINEYQKLYNPLGIPKPNPDTIKVTYSGRYIFKKNILTDISQKGSYSISDTPQGKKDIEAGFLMLTEKYKKLAYDKRKKKKNRIKFTE